MSKLPLCKLLMNHSSVERGLALLAPFQSDYATLDTLRREHLTSGLGPLFISLVPGISAQHWLENHGLFPWKPAPFDLNLIHDMTAYSPLYALDPAWGVTLPDDWASVYYTQRGRNRNPHKDLGHIYDVRLIQEHL